MNSLIIISLIALGIVIFLIIWLDRKSEDARRKNSRIICSIPYKCPCCHKKINYTNSEEWEESYSYEETVGGPARGRFRLFSIRTKTLTYPTEYVCPKCFKEMKRNRILIPVVSAFFFFLFVAMWIWGGSLSSGRTIKTIGIIGVIIYTISIVAGGHTITEVWGLCLRPILGPYKLHFMGENLLVSKRRLKEYDSIATLFDKLDKELARQYSFPDDKASLVRLNCGDYMARFHAIPEGALPPIDRLVNVLFPPDVVRDAIKKTEHEALLFERTSAKTSPFQSECEDDNLPF